MRHSNTGVCLRCEAFLEDAHPDIVFWFRFIQERFPTCHLSCTFRDQAGQEKEFKTKRSLLNWPDSKHNYMEDGRRLAKAMDLFNLLDSGKADWRMQYFAQIAKALKEADAPLAWGGDWKTLKDGPHYELKEAA